MIQLIPTLIRLTEFGKMTLGTFELSEQKKKLLRAAGNLLILGGPGSGKTTIALLKAQEIINGELKKEQTVLFLSFARATITRVEEQAQGMINREIRKRLEINTYHGFTWNLLKCHGYLLSFNSPLKLLPPPEASSRLASFAVGKERESEKRRLFKEEGLVDFDLFAELSARLLAESKSIAAIISNAYPVIILDEFQDTNQQEWNFINELGKGSRLIALADINQRIYEFRGADPARIGQFINTYKPSQYDFAVENNRSPGTDIVEFGNDLLTGFNKRKKYKNVNCLYYPFYKNIQHLDLKIQVINSIKRLNKVNTPAWSLAILVPTKYLMTSISDFLSTEQSSHNLRLPKIGHDLLLEMTGASLAAIVIARLLSKENSSESLQVNFLQAIYEHIRGRNGNKPPPKVQLELSEALSQYFQTNKIKGVKRQLLISESARICDECNDLVFSGDPGEDWISVRKLLLNSTCSEIKQVGEDAKFLRLLRKGAVLNSGLAELWRSSASYKGAYSLISHALLQEHFSSSTKSWRGVHIMTMHAAKGKEFDEVIIYDGPNKFRDRILNSNATDKGINQSILALRVAVTRAKERTLILTPLYDPCRLI